MTSIENIHLFHLVDGLDSYLKINFFFIQGFELYFLKVEPFLNQEPFLSNMFLPSETITVNGVTYQENEPILNTNLIYFLNLVKNELNSFKSICISSFQSLLGEKNKKISDYSFFTSFQTSQERFLKNIRNFFTLFYFFHTMTFLPFFHDTYEVISSELITLFNNQKIKRIDTSQLYKFNIRNMGNFSRKILRESIIDLYQQIKISGIIIEKISSKHRNNYNIIGSIMTNFLDYSNFFFSLFEKVVQYDSEWNDWNREVFEFENIDFTQRKLEGTWNDFLSNLSSSNFITSITIQNGGDRNIVGDILTLSTNSNTSNGTAVIISTLDGVIETIGTITSGGQGFIVGDILTLSNTTGLSANIEVASITSGFINGVTISNGGSGFIVGDSSVASGGTITTTSSSGTGLTILIDTVRGELDTITFSSNGSNYQVGDTLIISNSSGFTEANQTNARLIINSIQNAYISSISIVNGGNNYQVGDTINFSNDNITGIQTTVTSISINSIINSQVTITSGGNHPLQRSLEISVGNISNITATVNQINGITFTPSNLSITDTALYQLGDIFTINYGAITGIQATITEINKTLSESEFGVSGGSGFILGDTINFSYGELTAVLTVTSIYVTIQDNNLNISNGGSGWSLGSSLSINYGNIGVITTTIDGINVDEITFTPSNLSISDTALYQLGDIFTINYGAVTGIQATITEINKTLSESEFGVSGGSGFILGDTINFSYGGLTAVLTVTSIDITIDLSNIQMNFPGTGFSIGNTISYDYGSNISGTITVTDIGSSGEITSFSVTSDSGVISNLDTPVFTGNGNSTFQFKNISGSITGTSKNITNSPGIITSTDNPSYNTNSISGTGFSESTTLPFQGTLNNYLITNNGSGGTLTTSNTSITYSTNTGNVSGANIVFSGIEGSLVDLSVSEISFTVTNENSQTLSFTGDATISLQNISGSITGTSKNITNSPGIITSTDNPSYNTNSISGTGFSESTTLPFQGTLNNYLITNNGNGETLTTSNTSITYSTNTGNVSGADIVFSGIEGNVVSINITSGGSGTLFLSNQVISIQYTSETNETIPVNDLTITIDNITGQVNGLSIDNNGSGNFTSSNIINTGGTFNGSGIIVDMIPVGSIQTTSRESDGFGFMTTDTLEITGTADIQSFEIKNGQIYGVTITAGGENYSQGDTVTISKTGGTNATLNVSSIINGILKTVTVNNGGENYTEGGTITVSSENSTSNAILPVSTIQNGFITGLYLTNRGIGFSVGDTLTVTSSNTDTNLEVPILSVNSIQENSLFSLAEDINSMT